MNDLRHLEINQKHRRAIKVARRIRLGKTLIPINERPGAIARWLTVAGRARRFSA